LDCASKLSGFEPLSVRPHFNAADVGTVIVNGRVLMRGRRVESVDEAEVPAAAGEELELMLERTGLCQLAEEPVACRGRSPFD